MNSSAQLFVKRCSSFRIFKLILSNLSKESPSSMTTNFMKGYSSDPEVGDFSYQIRPLLEVGLPQFVVLLFNLKDFFRSLFIQPVDFILNLVYLLYSLLLFLVWKVNTPRFIASILQISNFNANPANRLFFLSFNPATHFDINAFGLHCSTLLVYY